MVEENQITAFHRAEIVSRLEIAYTRPRGAAFLDQHGPRVSFGFLIDEPTALKVRDFVQCYLMIDEYGAMQPNLSYPVHSLYLDSDGLDTYWDTINGNKNRFKLRLRYYDDRPDSPIFLEIKRRMN